MFKRHILIAVAAVASIGLAAAVHAQVALPQVQALAQTDLIQIIPRGQPSAQSVYAPVPRVTNTYGYYKSGANALTGGTYTFGRDVTYAMMQNAGTIGGLYFTLAAQPSDGALNCIFNIGIITATSISPNTGQSVNNGVTTLGALGQVCYLFSQSNATWDRVK